MSDEPEAWERGRWYEFAVPGGFTMFGRYDRHLAYGMVRFTEVYHLRNAGGRELAQLAAYDSPLKFPPEVKRSATPWPELIGAVIWFSKMGGGK